MKKRLISIVLNFISKVGYIARKLSISKNNFYTYCYSGELLVAESATAIHKTIHEGIYAIVIKNYNAIEENFEIRKMFKKIVETFHSPSIYQLKKQHPEIYNALLLKEVYGCHLFFRQNIEKGIQQELYRSDLNYRNYLSFYYPLIFGINNNVNSDREATKLELDSINYHTKLMATPKGIIELEKQIKKIKTLN